MVLAQASRWFHRFFQSHKVSTEYHVAIFNYDEQTIQAMIDIINGKEVVISFKEKGRLVSLLDRLGVKWEDQTTSDFLDRPPRSEKNAQNLRDNELTPSVSNVTLPPSILIPPASGSQVDMESDSLADMGGRTDFKEPAKVKEKEDIYAILDTFTETSEEELKRINHALVGKSGQKCRGYKCTICKAQSNYFSQAKKHHSEHEFEYLKPISEKMKKAEMNRKSEEQDIVKFEKAIGSTDKKRLTRVLRHSIENLEKHVEVLDSVEKARLPKHISEKCKQYTKNLLATIKKAENVIAKLGD